MVETETSRFFSGLASAVGLKGNSSKEPETPQKKSYKKTTTSALRSLGLDSKQYEDLSLYPLRIMGYYRTLSQLFGNSAYKSKRQLLLDCAAVATAPREAPGNDFAISPEGHKGSARSPQLLDLASEVRSGPKPGSGMGFRA